MRKYLASGLAFLLLLSVLAHGDVMNFVLFIGQFVKGCTNSQLVVDSSGKLACGIPIGSFGMVNSSTSDTISTGSAQLNGMVTPTLAAGTYLVGFVSDFNSATSGIVITLSFSLGGSQVAASQQKFEPFSGGTLTSGAGRHVSVLLQQIVANGSQTVQVEALGSASGATVANKTMVYYRML